MKDDITLLCTGDLHLGRHPTRIPAEIDGKQFSPKAAWRSTVEEAIDRDVDVVLISGDVVDRENRYFEAYGPFEAGIDRLDAEGIPTVVIAGNHDFDVLPGLMDGLEHDRAHFIGEDGEWERTTVGKDGHPILHIDGWSFPTEHVLQSPLDTYDGSNPTDAPLVGLVHADLDTPESEYAPVPTAALVDTPVDAWILGHIHKPDVRRSADPSIIYPGSPQPLDPGERGSHGPWLVTVDSMGNVDATQIAVAGLRYDRLEMDVSHAADSKDVPSIVSDHVSEHVHNNVDTGPLDLLLARITLDGRTAAHGTLVDDREAIEDQLSFTVGSLAVRVETLEVETRPAVDLDEMATGDSPVAYLADLLLSIERGTVDDEHRELVAEAQDAMQRAHASSAYDELRREDTVARPDETDAIATLERQAMLLLDELLAQKGS